MSSCFVFSNVSKCFVFFYNEIIFKSQLKYSKEMKRKCFLYSFVLINLKQRYFKLISR